MISQMPELHDIHVPEPVSWWPLAWGWWCVIGLLLLGIAVLLHQQIKKYQFNKVRREALFELTQRPIPIDLKDANILLKRVCLHYFPQDVIAPLHGKVWVDFLTNRLPQHQQQEFRQGWQQLVDNLYQSPQSCPRVQAGHLSILWLNGAKLTWSEDNNV